MTGDRLRARRHAANASDRAAITQIAPTQPSARDEALANVSEPRAAPDEKPRNWNDALSESATGATFTPAMLMSRACWTGKNDHADTPHMAMASRIDHRGHTATSANEGPSFRLDAAAASSPSKSRPKWLRLSEGAVGKHCILEHRCDACLLTARKTSRSKCFIGAALALPARTVCERPCCLSSRPERNRL